MSSTLLVTDFYSSSRGRLSRKGPPQEVEIPLIYALLENKQEVSYKKVLNIVIERARINNINVRLLHRLMTDFKLAINNAARDTFGADKVNLCLFHLGQSVLRHFKAKDYNSSIQVRMLHLFTSKHWNPLPTYRKLNSPDFLPVFNYFKAWGGEEVRRFEFGSKNKKRARSQTEKKRRSKFYYCGRI